MLWSPLIGPECASKIRINKMHTRRVPDALLYPWRKCNDGKPIVTRICYSPLLLQAGVIRNACLRRGNLLHSILVLFCRPVAVALVGQKTITNSRMETMSCLCSHYEICYRFVLCCIGPYVALVTILLNQRTECTQ